MEARWYIINAVAGFESKISAAISDVAAKKGVSDKFVEIVVPTQSVTEVRRGKKVVSDKKIYPGYILIKMFLDEVSWNLVKAVPKVSGFLSNNGKPVPISEAEVANVMSQVRDGMVVKDSGVAFAVGDSVKIREGAFETFVGVVEDVDVERSIVRVGVSIFGRAAPVELSFSQVDKV